MLDLSRARVFVFSVEIDMRKGFEALSYFVRESMRRNVMEGDVYLFLGKNPRRAKALFFDGTGLVLIAKRLERGRFQRLSEFDERSELTHEELGLIFAGTRINFSFTKKDFAMGAPSQITAS